MSFGFDWRRRRAGIIGLGLLGACASFVLYPSGTFPIGREFEVASINGRKIAGARPTFRVGWLTKPLSIKTWPIQSWATGSTGCNGWNARVVSLWAGRVVLDERYQTAMACGCRIMEVEHAFNAAIQEVTTWRRDGADIILEGGRAVPGRGPATIRLVPLSLVSG